MSLLTTILLVLKEKSGAQTILCAAVLQKPYVLVRVRTSRKVPKVPFVSGLTSRLDKAQAE